MPQYGVLVYSPAPADPMELPPEHIARIDEYPAQAKKLRASVLGGSYFAAQRGFAFESSATATSIRGDGVSAGPLIESDLVPAAFFVIQAPDLDTAVQVAKLHPAVSDGGVEVRPLVPPPAK